MNTKNINLHITHRKGKRTYIKVYTDRANDGYTTTYKKGC